MNAENTVPSTDPAVRVSKLGYVGFETPDVDRLVDYYTTVLDFELVDKSAGGAFLTTGFDHHCVVITQGDAQGRACVGYEIWEPLAEAQRRLRAAGYEVERRSDIGPGTPDALVLTEPGTGTPLHLFQSQESSGVDGRAVLRPAKLGHVAAFVPRLFPMQAFYQDRCWTTSRTTTTGCTGVQAGTAPATTCSPTTKTRTATPSNCSPSSTSSTTKRKATGSRGPGTRASRNTHAPGKSTWRPSTSGDPSISASWTTDRTPAVSDS